MALSLAGFVSVTVITLVNYSGLNSCLSLNEQEWERGGPNVQSGTDFKEGLLIYTSQLPCDTGSAVKSILRLWFKQPP